MMDADDLIGPVNLGNPGEFTILELAEKVRQMTGSRSRSSASRCPRTIPSAGAPTSPWPSAGSAGNPRSRSKKGSTRTIDYFRGARLPA